MRVSSTNPKGDNIVNQEVADGPEFLRFCIIGAKRMIDDSSDEDGHGYATLVTQRFVLVVPHPLFVEVIVIKKIKLEKDEDSG